MKHAFDVIAINRIRGFRPDPTLTSEEAIVLRALANGKNNEQICSALHIALLYFLEIMRDLREKTGAVSDVSLLVWAQRHLKNGDQRLDRQERDYPR
jgi:DNA-binding CsgD family transcriptional regulator